MSKKRWLVALSLLLFVIFIYFSYLVAKGRFTQFDFDTMVKFQGRIPDKAINPSLALTVIGSFEFSSLIWFCLVVFALFKRWWLVAVFLLLFPIGLLFELYGKTFVHHPSPPKFLLKGFIPVDLPKYYITEQFAYPSGHMFRTSFLATFLLGLGLVKAALNTKVILVCVYLLFIIAMGVTRIYLGEHWVSDVIGGTLLGISFGLLTWIAIPQNNKVLK